MQYCVAVDIGASSGRITAGWIDAETLQTQEVHRFQHEAIEIPGRGLRVQWQKIVEEVAEGIRKAKLLGEIESIGIDTWAVDYGLLNSVGELIEEPYCYRDARTDGVMKFIQESVGSQYIYQKTGVQFIFFNTAYQLYSARNSFAVSEAQTFLMLPDLLNYTLSGVASSEITNASTTQLFNAHTQQWDWELIDKLEIPRKIFLPLHRPGSKIGRISGHGQIDGISVVAVGSHDTASAVAGVPMDASKNSAYISSGTWSLVGLELEKPITNPQALACNITNEVGVADRIRFIKNVSGMWLLEESIRYWKSQGIELTASELARAAESFPRNQIIDTNDLRFTKPGAMPERISDYCRETNQLSPTSPPEFARCIFESLADAYALSLRQLEQVSGLSVNEINIVGGGSSNELLNQLTANSTGLKVLAGPVEATILGNLITQMISAGWIASLEEGRNLIAHSVEQKIYFPTTKGDKREA